MKAEHDFIYKESYRQYLRKYFAAMATPDMEGWTKAAVEKILGVSMPDYDSQFLENIMFWARFKAALKLIEADALLAELEKS